MKQTKKYLSLVLAIMLVMSLCNIPTKAATKKKSVTMYIGEELNIYPVIGTIKKQNPASQRLPQ